MKNQLIATAVAGLIIFIWQFMTWGMLNLHGAEFTYTPNQDAILAALHANLTEDGNYYLPTLPPGSTQDQHETAMKDMMGKPWAMIKYHKSMEMSMGTNMLRGITVDLLAAFLLIWLLTQFRETSFKTILSSSLAVGFIGYLSITYTNRIWFETNSIVYLLDTVVIWGLVGCWLGWWMNRGGK
ncbi:MAG: hypothetical protein IPM34_06820 [Saprospiraceae bacterium]|nr:hypothetical protein [Saprospiraceae bacterium]